MGPSCRECFLSVCFSPFLPARRCARSEEPRKRSLRLRSLRDGCSSCCAPGSRPARPGLLPRGLPPVPNGREPRLVVCLPLLFTSSAITITIITSITIRGGGPRAPRAFGSFALPFGRLMLVSISSRVLRISLSIYTYIYAYMYACMYVYIYIYIYKHIYIYIYIYVYIYIYICIHTYVYIHIIYYTILYYAMIYNMYDII